MRIHALTSVTLAIVTVATIWTAAPARAQTYDPKYPVCLEAYGDQGSVIECGFTSLAQCAQATSGGRSGLCFVNPYFGGADAPPAPREQRPRAGG